MGQLKLSMPDNAEKQLDLSKIARSVATTRIGQRLHQQVANNIAQKKAKDSLGKKVRFCLSIFCFTFTCFFLFFVCFFVNLIFCIINYFFMLFDWYYCHSSHICFLLHCIISIACDRLDNPKLQGLGHGRFGRGQNGGCHEVGACTKPNKLQTGYPPYLWIRVS